MTPTEMLIPPQILDVLLTGAGAKAAALLRVEDQSIVARTGDLNEAGFEKLVSTLGHGGSMPNEDGSAPAQEIRLDNDLFVLTAQALAQNQFRLAMVFPISKARSDVHQEMMLFSRVLEALLPVNIESAISLEKSEEGFDPNQASVCAEKMEKLSSSTANDWVHLNGAIVETDPEQVPDSSITPLSSPDGILPEKTWQTLSELDQPEDDLASIFQNDFALQDTALDQEPWLTPPDPVFHEVVEPAVKSEQSISPEPLDVREQQVDGIEVSDATFFLIPFRKDHHLVDDLAKRLREWLPAICQKYGWQLVSLSIRPGYLRWMLADFPNLLSQEMLRIVRRETSWRIFRLFPGLQSVEQEADFWAPGILMATRNPDLSEQPDLHTFLSSSR